MNNVLISFKIFIVFICILIFKSAFSKVKINSKYFEYTNNIKLIPHTSLHNDFDFTPIGYKGYNSFIGLSSDNLIKENRTILEAEIDVTGLNISINGNGTNIPSQLNNTDFGHVQVKSQTITKTFVINNIGTSNLTLGTISLTGPSEFKIKNAPVSGSIIAPNNKANIVISFSTSTLAIQTDVLTIISNDSDEAYYKINLTAKGNQVFFDSDGDGIYDDIDIDDDNDGIKDSEEENACRASNGTSLVDYKFLNETFGTGVTRGTGISSIYSVYTAYCLEDGSSSSNCSGSNPDVEDGEYTIASFITNEDGTNPTRTSPTGTDIANWAWYAWAPIEDHTLGDSDGRMAIFNADVNPGIFYETEITGTLSNIPVTYSFWVINIDEPDQNFIDEEHSGNASSYNHRNLPNITVNFLTLDRSTVIATYNTGDITRCGDSFVPTDHTGTYPHIADANYNTCETSVWQQFTQQFSSTETAFVVQFVNNTPGGEGNNFAIDDIQIRQSLCDMDNDLVANIFDLDSDNDGIPDVIEANNTAASLSEGKGTLTGTPNWTDANKNGMLDNLEALVSIDTDGDGVFDYLDLDSDNDGLFDVDESGAINSNDTSFQNGDGDITGDGIGDGSESETFRAKDSNGDGIIEAYGDGILDIYDFHEGNTSYSDSYGNNSQGIGPLYTLDSDHDGIPDYKDPYNDLTSTYNIDTVEIYASLPNLAGVLTSTTDMDGDGVMASRDGDDTIFGSPRNLDSSYSLSFDGRNDYIEDANIIASGDATLMAFVKTNGSNINTDNQIVAGQDDLYIIIDDVTNIVSVVVEGTTISSKTALIDGVWAHVAVTTTSTSGGQTTLYINGVAEATTTSGGIIDDTNFNIGRSSAGKNYFKGEIDEVRIFDVALTNDELKKMVYQELDETNSFNSGKIIPTNISASIGSNLIKYYKMDGYQNDILDDKKTVALDVVGAKMYNFKDIYFQRAPLPYVTNLDGDWTDATSWVNGSEWDIMTKQNNPTDASIVHIKHNINLNKTYDTQGMIGLIVDSGKEFTIEPNKGLFINWYLMLNGLIDLEEESQLIQTNNSILEPTSSGTLEKDQQGTADTYTYNYWSSPVGFSNNTTNNNSYTLPNIINNVNFLTYGYNGTASPVAVADYWIWKFNNLPNNNYSSWQHIRSTGRLLVGEGFTMKGPGTGSILADQNYIMEGKPNNGDINLPVYAGNEYLIGNPYPSAIDANQFILDNSTTIAGADTTTGTLYFWEHWGGGSHASGEHQGGYATYSLAGGVPAASMGTNDPDLATGGTPTKTPGRYIPVAQGFFVTAKATGKIQFNNGQRIFQVEGEESSLFIKTSNTKSENSNKETDLRTKIRIGFNSVNKIHRQLLATIDETNGTPYYDWGYDALYNDDQMDDMYWLIDDNKYTIQATNEINSQTVFPLGIHTKNTGLNSITIDKLENVPSSLVIYLHDKELGIYHDLLQGNYQIYLNGGEYLDRFEITFENKESSLGNEDFENENIEVYFSNEKEGIIVNNPTLKKILSIKMYNVLGQNVFETNKNISDNYTELNTKQIKAGAYIIQFKTEENTISKKVLIK